MTATAAPVSNLDLGLVGNATFSALIDTRRRVDWSCPPAFDGDPAFFALLQPPSSEGCQLAAWNLQNFPSHPRTTH